MDYPQKLAQLLSRPSTPSFDWDATNRAAQYQAMADGAPAGAVGAPGGILPYEPPRQAPSSFQDYAGAASFLPGIGDAAGLMGDASMYATDPSSRTPGNYALSAAGLLPFVPAASVTEKLGQALKPMAKEWEFTGLPLSEIREQIRSHAEQLAERFKQAGFISQAEHSGSAAGPSSYVSVFDPQTERFFTDQLRISNHGKGPFQNQFVTNIYGPDDADAMFSRALQMRAKGPTESFLRRQEQDKIHAEKARQRVLKDAKKNLRLGRPLTAHQQSMLDKYGAE
jgi:hypothetical protein